MSDAVHGIRYCTNYEAVIETKTYSENFQAFKMEHFAKRIMTECRRGTRNFSRQGSFRGIRVFPEIFRQKHKKNEPAGKHFGAFFL